MSKYDEIVNLPHHVSRTRKPMTLYNRAAQFAPFAALIGHDDAIEETARLTSAKVELSLDEQTKLSRRLEYVLQHSVNVLVTYFVPDSHKEGGSYSTHIGVVKKMDEYENTVVFADGKVIPMVDIYGINAEIFNDIEF